MHEMRQITQGGGNLKKYKIVAHTKDTKKITVCYTIRFGEVKAREQLFDTTKEAQKKIKEMKGLYEAVERFEIVETIPGFFEDGDGEVVLSDVRNFLNEEDFLRKAEQYVKDTRGYRVPVLKPSITDIKFNDDEWKNADEPEFEGEKLTVYAASLDYENKEM